MKNRFDGKVALVTGAATGIGRAIAFGFAREGAKVIVNTRSNVRSGEAVVADIKAEGGEAAFVQGDVSKESDVIALIEKTLALYGGLDCAANNAGVGPDGVRLPVVDIKDYTEDLWDNIVDINLKGVLLLMKHEIRQMLKQGGGSIVNTGSIAAMNTQWGFAAYHSSKAGLNKLSQIAAIEYAMENIRVNVVMPGPIGETLLTENLTKDPQQLANFTRKVVMHRLGKPSEVANAALFLASDEASFITGHAIPVDGGMSLVPNEL
ncbi:MAG: glucose 1-dehydrogenase [Clostridiales Family XIII bacterium]|jgi:NAD(P)-dependent dehydrogenase (short-subunit alcohol dehydrogenase family)|nr:glucose 1-dehydrogenase [Clostridiales Family XIII bacterium]